MRILIVMTVLILAGLRLSPAQADTVSEFHLDNGMQVVVIEDRRAPVAVHMVWYKVGAADEPPGKSGIAHFLEHLMFKGTDTRAPGEFSAVVEANGGRDNAFTSWDYTGYFQRVASDRLDLMMEMEADRMANLSFTEDEWLPERSVILEERGQVLESRPGAVLNEQMRAALYQNHPYGPPIIGWRHEMAGLTGDDAMAFYRRHYGPNNAILVVAGDVAADAVLELARIHYGPIPPNPSVTERDRPMEPPAQTARRVVYEDPRVGQPYVSRFYRIPPRQSGDQSQGAALQMLAALLGGTARTSHLERRLTVEEGVALQAWAGYLGTGLDYGLFTLGIAPADGVTLAEAEAALDRELAAFLEAEIDPEQFARVQMQLRASEIFGLDDAQARAREYGTALASGLSVADVDGWLDALLSVAPEAVLAAGRDLLDIRNSVTGWISAPPAEAEELTQ